MSANVLRQRAQHDRTQPAGQRGGRVAERP
jgi:hypothetical protein